MILQGGVAILLTYALSWVLLKGVEEPMRNLLTSGRVISGALLQRMVWWYSVVVMGLGPVANIAAITASIIFVKPHMEQAILNHFDSLSNHTTTAAAAAAAAAD